MIRLTGIIFILLFACDYGYCQQTITTEDELNEMRDLSRLPLYRTGTSLNQVSTYDREGKNDDGFSGKYSFIRRNADSSLVMFEAKGAGVINRIWTPTPTEDTLDFYIDNSVFSIKYSDLFSGKVKPFAYPLCGTALGGNYCYYPFLFQDSCRIVSRGKKLQFHQVQWRSYPDQTLVKNKFNEFHLPEEDFEPVPATSLIVNANKSATLFEQFNGGRISSFKISPATVFAGMNKDIWLKITYDDEKVPAVFCPAADFFGYAFGSPSMRSNLSGVTNDTAYFNIPLPFDKHCKVELINKKKVPVRMSFAFDYSSNKRNPVTEGKLYTSYSHVRHSINDGQHLLLNTSGKGHFIGTILQCQGTAPGMTLFFEGDDSTVVDGKLTLHGTGSEDYFNGGWYAFPDRWDAAFSLPFHGSLDYSLPYCRTGAYRFYLSDKIPFEKTFYHSIEHGPVNNNIPAIYTSLSFYYGSQPPVKLSVSNDVTVYEPDTLNIYPQLNNINIWYGSGVKSLWAHDTGGLSYVYTVSDETSLRFSLDDIEDGEYELFMDYDKIPSGAEVKVLQRQRVVKELFSAFSRDSVRIKMERVGVIEKNNFMRTISLEFKTDSGNNQFFLNRFVLVKFKSKSSKSPMARSAPAS